MSAAEHETYNNYTINPAKPDDHPILTGNEDGDSDGYDPAILNAGQMNWESKRLYRRQTGLAAPAEERKQEHGDEEDGDEQNDNPFPMIADHDFEGTFNRCTECDSNLWGTKTIWPLSRPISVIRDSIVTAPCCVGCSRLYAGVKTTEEKNEIITYFLTGDFKNKDKQCKPEDFMQRCKSIASSMKTRAKTMRKSKEERKLKKEEKRLIRETYKKRYKNAKKKPSISEKRRAVKEIRRQVRAELKKKRGKKVKSGLKKNEDDVIVASAQELAELAHSRSYRCAVLGYRCELEDSTKFNYMTFDHIEPVTHVKHITGSFGTGNIQPMCSVLNNIKGDYNEKELSRWVILLLTEYNRRYDRKNLKL